MNRLEKQPPAFQFYVDDFLGGVDDFCQAEVGAYQLLLCHQWNRGAIPPDPKRQQLIARGPISSHVLAKFEIGEDGFLRNRRLEHEREKQRQYRSVQSERGKKGGDERWRKHGVSIPPAIPPAMAPAIASRMAPAIAPAMPQALLKPMLGDGSPVSSLQSPIHKDHKASGKPDGGSGFTPEQKELTARLHLALADQWENDRQKWMGRIKHLTSKTERVVAEVESAVKEGRIKTTPAQYAENIWEEFQ